MRVLNAIFQSFDETSAAAIFLVEDVMKPGVGHTLVFIHGVVDFGGDKFAVLNTTLSLLRLFFIFRALKFIFRRLPSIGKSKR